MASRRSFLQATAGALSLPWTKPGMATLAESSVVPGAASGVGEQELLFPTGLAPFQWREFRAAAYSRRVTGIIYRNPPEKGYGAFSDKPGPRPVSGVPLGGIDTGGLDLDGWGAFGYSSIFNHSALHDING